MYRGQIEFAHIESYHDAPGLIQALANRVEEGLRRWPAEKRPEVHVVFSAHSLPVRITQMGDPYADQLLETARLVAGKRVWEKSNGPGATSLPGAAPSPGWDRNCRSTWKR
jgi:protoporphyrin/coproporphyrin ferrochelatase